MAVGDRSPQVSIESQRENDSRIITPETKSCWGCTGLAMIPEWGDLL
jgi:hypothetical protein